MNRKEKRKLIKKIKRKKIRQKLAQIRDETELVDQDEIESDIKDENLQWIKREKLQEIEGQKLHAEETLIKTRGKEIARKKKFLEHHRKFVQEKENRRQIILNQLCLYLSGKSQLPHELSEPIQSHPDNNICSYFNMTGTCRNGDMCFRNHVRPAVSKILLLPNIFHHNLLDLLKIAETEPNTDLYKAFLEFYEDCVPEFEKFGRILQFRVCYNLAAHLKGNLYVEFEELKHCIEAFQAMFSRFYDGRQLLVEFVSIKSWQYAVCGNELRRKCSKGSGCCQFLHVFKNPQNRFPLMKQENFVERSRSRESFSRKFDRKRHRKWSVSLSPKSRTKEGKEKQQISQEIEQ